MSYSKIKNISIKKDSVTITSAESNIRPITYYTGKNNYLTKMLNEKGEKEVIKDILFAFDSGDFQSVSSNCDCYVYAINNKDEHMRKLHSNYWNYYDYKTKTEIYTKEQREEFKEELKELLYNKYLEAQELKKDKNEYLIEIANKGYFYNTTKYGYKYTYQPVKSFNLLRAKILSSSIKDETKLIKVNN
jgi:hypothetical protein